MQVINCRAASELMFTFSPRAHNVIWIVSLRGNIPLTLCWMIVLCVAVSGGSTVGAGRVRHKTALAGLRGEGAADTAAEHD